MNEFLKIHIATFASLNIFYIILYGISIVIYYTKYEDDYWNFWNYITETVFGFILNFLFVITNSIYFLIFMWNIIYNLL